MPGPLVSQAAIKKAYRSKSLEFHPDKCEGDKAGFFGFGDVFFGGLFFFEDFHVVFFVCCFRWRFVVGLFPVSPVQTHVCVVYIVG